MVYAVLAAFDMDDSVISDQEREAILAHADDYLSMQAKVEEIVEWGRSEMQREEARLIAEDAEFGEFTKSMDGIHADVKSRLAKLDADIRTRFPEL